MPPDHHAPAFAADPFAGFAYLAAEKGWLYRAIVTVFADAKAGFLLHLRPADVLRRLTASGTAIEGGLESIEAALAQLCEWRVLEAYNDNSDVATLADFHRRRLQYQLTAEGEAVYEAARLFLERLNRRITLDAAALGRIHDDLSELTLLMQDPEIDGEKAFGILRHVVTDVEELTDRAQSFFRWLHEQTESRRSDLSTFLEFKERLIEYLREFVGELVARGARIANTLRQLENRTEELLQAVVDEETRDTYDASDPTGIANREESRRRWRNRWTGLRCWFLDDAAGPAQSRQLQVAARAAIPRVLALAQQQRLRQNNRSDRPADLRELAAWFLEAEDDRAAHQLWRAAFGLSPARHLFVDETRLQDMDAAAVTPDTPWSAAPPVIIDPQLRQSGRQRAVSAVRTIVDTAEARQELRRRLAENRRHEAAIRGELLSLGRRQFSDIDRLSQDSFQLMLELVGSATDARRPDSSVSRGTSRDGRLTIEVDWKSDTRPATIATPDGFLNLSNATFQITAE